MGGVNKMVWMTIGDDDDVDCQLKPVMCNEKTKKQKIYYIVYENGVNCCSDGYGVHHTRNMDFG